MCALNVTAFVLDQFSFTSESTYVVVGFAADRIFGPSSTLNMVTDSWFRSFWKTSKKNEFHTGKMQISFLAFEAASLMSKLFHLWQLLTDKQVARLREEIANSVGIRKLVSDDDDYIGRLICAEMTHILENVARAVARLCKKCNDPLLKSFEQAFSDLIKDSADTYGWQLSWKEMEKKAKKMERFIIVNNNLYQEMEILADLEQTLKRMKNYDNTDSITLVEYEKKVAWKRQDVKHLKENSLWNRTYDYTISLLARSLFTIYYRIGHVFGTNSIADAGVGDSRVTDINNSRRSHSTVFMQSSVYPSDNCAPRLSSSSAGKFISVSGPLLRTNNMGNFHSGPLGSSTTTSSPISRKHTGATFYSGPLVKSTSKSGFIPKASKHAWRLLRFRGKSVNEKEKIPCDKIEEVSTSGSFSGCATSAKSSALSNIMNSNVGDVYSGSLVKEGSTKSHVYLGTTVTASPNKLLNAPPETLGAAALALHYANVIIFIEKLVASPHLIGNDARADLYNMLPASLRAALRTKLKPYAKTLSSSVYDTALAGEWNEAMLRTLEWLSPLAHNMIRWQSERTIEHQNLISKTNVLLVQTLYFAKQEKTEETITELLVGLNYIWRFGRDIDAKTLVECASGRTFDEYLD